MKEENAAALPCPECDSEALYGVEVQGVFDGTLFWVCEGGHSWPRFAPPSRLHEAALVAIQSHEEAV